MDRSHMLVQRRTDIDTIRAIACIALVSFHAVGAGPKLGMELPPDHWMSVMNRALVDLRMPLFSFISGFVFVAIARPGTTPLTAILKKARRLLIPMLCVGALFWIARDVSGHVQQPLIHIAVMPFAHYWFLQATFLIMAIFMGLVWLARGQSVAVALILFCVAAALWVSPIRPSVNPFSIVQALHLTPFFMAGYLLAHLPRQAHLALKPGDRIGFAVAGMTLVLAVSVGVALATGILSASGAVRRLAGLGLGLAFCLALFTIRPRNVGFAWIGKHSFAIYLYHVFFTAGIRAGLAVAAPGLDLTWVWLLTLAGGLAGPIAVQHLLQRSSATALLGLGIWMRPDEKGPGASDQTHPETAHPPAVLAKG